MRVSNLPCKVVATLHPKGLSLSGQDQDDTIILPYTTAMKEDQGHYVAGRHSLLGSVYPGVLSVNGWFQQLQ
jgi:hypothetical protein